MKHATPIEILKLNRLVIRQDIKRLSPPICKDIKYNDLIILDSKYTASIKILEIMEL